PSWRAGYRLNESWRGPSVAVPPVEAMLEAAVVVAPLVAMPATRVPVAPARGRLHVDRRRRHVARAVDHRRPEIELHVCRRGLREREHAAGEKHGGAKRHTEYPSHLGVTSWTEALLASCRIGRWGCPTHFAEIHLSLRQLRRAPAQRGAESLLRAD